MYHNYFRGHHCGYYRLVDTLCSFDGFIFFQDFHQSTNEQKRAI